MRYRLSSGAVSTADGEISPEQSVLVLLVEHFSAVDSLKPLNKSFQADPDDNPPDQQFRRARVRLPCCRSGYGVGRRLR